MARDLTDRTIVITGASAGIGWHTALEAARAGMHPILAARRTERLEKLAELVRQIGRDPLVVSADVAKDEDVDRLVERTMAKYERLDVMFANAGYGGILPVETMTDLEQRHMFEVNYFGTVRCCRAAIPPMKAAGGGHIVISSSIVARVGIPYHTTYAATKAAQDALATGMRLELEPYRIDVSCLYPVGTKTEFFEVAARVGGRQTLSEHTPELFMQRPEHVARRVVRGLRKPQLEIWPARWARYAAGIATMMPRLTRLALRRHAENDRQALPDR